VLEDKICLDLAILTGRRVAHIFAINLIVQLNDACGVALPKLVQIVKIRGFVGGYPDFQHSPQVIDSASKILIRVFGQRVRHSGFAIAVNSSPRNKVVEATEIDGVCEKK
jgi:hypothetical protein